MRRCSRYWRAISPCPSSPDSSPWRSPGGRSAALARSRKASRTRCSLKNAIELTLLFQVVLYVVHYVRQWVGDAGLMATGFVLGLTDVDALTLSMTRSVATGVAVQMACRAILAGIIANSIMKAIIAFAIGTRRFAWQAGGALVAMAGAGAAAILWL